MFLDFNLDKVKIYDAYFGHRRELVKKYVLNFPIDRLMHTFKKNAGIESVAEPLGGWESEGCDLKGHFVGHFMSSCSRYAFADKDSNLVDKINEIINILEKCAKPNGYLSAFNEDVLDTLELEENRNVWAPYYTLHKIVQGLIDCYKYVGNNKALDLAKNLAIYIYNRFEKLSFWKIDGILRCTKVNPVNEFGGIGDALYSLYEISKDDRILSLAKTFDREYFVGNLIKGNDILENLHANTHLPMVIAAMHRFDITNEIDYKTATENFYEFLLGRSFANGNNSSKATAYIKCGVSEKSEHWGAYNKLDDALTGGESECCCAHNTEKIAVKVFEWSDDVKVLDHIESLKYNAVLNSSSHTNGLSQYHQPMGTGCVKKFSSFYNDFWCCTASGIEAMSEVQKNIYFQNGDSILVNMFVTSDVLWDKFGVKIAQQTTYPDCNLSKFIINTQKPTEFKLMFKQSSIKSIKLNCQDIDLSAENGFFVVNNIFCDGDIIEIEINSCLHLEPLKGSDEKSAIMYGHILLAQLGEKEYVGNITNENIVQKLTKTDNKQLTFSLRDEDGENVYFIPLFRVETETYTVYLNTKNISTQNTNFSFAKDGSSAYA